MNVASGSHSNMSNALPPMTATVATGPPNSRSYPQTLGSSQQRNYATATSASAAQEHKKLFAAGARRNPAMRGNSLSGKGKGKRVPTCTLKFFCLSRVDASGRSSQNCSKRGMSYYCISEEKTRASTTFLLLIVLKE